MRQEDYFELLVYMITSAAGLKGEPKIYGPLRRIEASERLCSRMLKEEQKVAGETENERCPVKRRKKFQL